jgi:hypothetical protein
MVDHLKEVAWSFFLVLLFLVSLFVIFGRQIGFCLHRCGSLYDDTLGRIVMVWNAQLFRTYFIKKLISGLSLILFFVQNLKPR